MRREGWQEAVNLQVLLDRAKAGTYRAPPVRRVHIPKGGSATETRPIGIPTLEDKVLQRAVAMLRKFLDTLDHTHLRAFLQQRVRDGVFTRLIGV